MKSKIYGMLMLAGTLFCSCAGAMNDADQSSAPSARRPAHADQLCKDIPDDEISSFNKIGLIGVKKSDEGLVYMFASGKEELLGSVSHLAYRTLAIAIDKSCQNIVNYCLRIGCNPNYTGYYPNARLFFGNPKLLSFLSQAVDKAMSCNPEVYEQAIEIVNILLKSNADPNENIGAYSLPSKSTLLNFVLGHDGSYERRRELVEILLNNKADPNAVSGKFETSPLEMAVKLNDEEIVRLLLKKNANPNILIPDTDRFAYEQFGTDLIITPFVLAVKNYNLKMMEYLLDSIFDVRQKIHEDLLLIWAISLNQPDMIDLLLKFGAVPNKKIPGLCSPIQYAIKGNYTDAAVRLLKKGSMRLDADDHNSISALKYAMLHRREELIGKLFTEAGFNPNAPDVDGELPILSAVKIDPDLIRVLISSGAYINNVFRYSGRNVTILNLVLDPAFLGYILYRAEERDMPEEDCRENEEEEEEFEGYHTPNNPECDMYDIYQYECREPRILRQNADLSDDFNGVPNLYERNIIEMLSLWPRERIIMLLMNCGARTLEVLFAEARRSRKKMSDSNKAC